MEAQAYYAGTLTSFTIPDENLQDVVARRPIPAHPNPVNRLRERLDHPIGTRKLVDLVKPSDKVVLMTSEYMRMPYTWVLGPVVVNLLREAGVERENITLVNAPGTHQTEQQQARNPLVQKVFGTLSGKHRLVMHDCDRPAELAYMGMTRQGTPVWVNKVVAAADVKIGFGELSPHHSAGSMGGGKIINPGVCGRASIGSMHRRVLVEKGIPDYKQIQVGVHDERNAVRKDIEDSAVVAGLDFKIDVLTNYPRRDIVDVFAGDFKAEYREGVRLGEKVYGTTIDKLADISISLHADPREMYLTRGLLTPQVDAATKDDGIIIKVVSAEEGFARSGAHLTFNPRLMKLPATEMERRLVNNKCNLRDMSLMWQVRKSLDQHRTFLVTKYRKQAALRYGFTYVTRSFDDALTKALDEKGRDATVDVVYDYHDVAYPIASWL